MASQSQGIQQLLQAEKRAAEKVSEARKRKNRRLKQAKEEAQAEIEQYRLQREKEFKAKEAANIHIKNRCHVFIIVNLLLNLAKTLTSNGSGIARQLQQR
uniref:V-type proton ATPase subunit G n=1 Tax=Equus caballus TaxID=9796 RepID=A0A9L0S2E7_HORSE